MPMAMVTPNQGIFSEKNLRKLQNITSGLTGNIKDKNGVSFNIVERMQKNITETNIGYRKDLEKAKNEIINKVVNKIIAHIDNKDFNVVIKEYLEENKDTYSEEVTSYLCTQLLNQHSKDSNVTQPFYGAVQDKTKMYLIK